MDWCGSGDSFVEMSLDVCTYRVEDHEDDAKQWEIEEERGIVPSLSGADPLRK